MAIIFTTKSCCKQCYIKYLKLTFSKQLITDGMILIQQVTVFSLGNSTEVNASGGTYVAYVLANKPGYFKYGNMEGNGNADGRFVYTGGRPSMVLMKRILDGLILVFMGQ